MTISSIEGFPFSNEPFTKRLQDAKQLHSYVTSVSNRKFANRFRQSGWTRYYTGLDRWYGFPLPVTGNNRVQRFPSRLPGILLLIKPAAGRSDAFPIHGQCQQLRHRGREALSIVG